LIAYSKAAHAARRRPLTPAMMRGEVFRRLPRSVRYGFAVDYDGSGGYLRVTYRGRAFASFADDGSHTWTRCKIPPGTPPVDSAAFRKGHAEFQAVVATLASTWTLTTRPACGGRSHAREAASRSRRRRSRRASRAGPSGDDGSGLGDPDSEGPAGRADARRPIAAEVRR